jgi:hypothetical protein
MSKTLTDVVNTAPDSYVEGGFTATVVQPASRQTKTGKTFFKATLQDGNVTVDATSFSQTFDHWAGKRVRFYGQGIKRGADYNGKAQVTLGDRVKVSVEGEAGASSGSPSPAPAIERAPAPVMGFKERLDGYTGLFKHCYFKAQEINAQFELSPEDTRQIATAFFIQGVRDGLHNDPKAL